MNIFLVAKWSKLRRADINYCLVLLSKNHLFLLCFAIFYGRNKMLIFNRNAKLFLELTPTQRAHRILRCDFG